MEASRKECCVIYREDVPKCLTWRPATGVVMPSWRPECDGVLNSKKFGTSFCCDIFDIGLLIQGILLFTWSASQILDRRQETTCFTQDFELAESQVEREMVRLEQVHTNVCHQTSPQIRVHQEKEALETAFFMGVLELHAFWSVKLWSQWCVSN